MSELKFSSRMSIAAGSSILAGFILYWIDSQGFTSAWMSSGAGRGFGIGAGFALIGFVFGVLIGRTTKAMAQVGAQIQGKPSPDQMNQLQALRKKQATYSMIAASTLVLATIFMAIARYL
jgi:Na+/glutamate symporter